MSDPSATGDPGSSSALIGAGAPAIRLLLIEDDPADARPVHDALDAAGGFEVQWVTRLGAGLMTLRGEPFDAVLADLGLPDSSGFRTVMTLRAAFPDVPVVALARRDEEEIATESVRAGAEDFVLKGRARGSFIPRVVRQAVERHRSRRDVSTLALIDDLTGLANRRAFLAVSGHRMKLSRRTGEPLSVIAMALRRDPGSSGGRGAFALVDSTLRDASTLLRETLRESDLVARLGGDAFAVLLTGGEDLAKGAMQRLLEAVQQHNDEAGRSYRLSFDVAAVRFDASRHHSIDDLLADAPLAGERGPVDAP